MAKRIKIIVAIMVLILTSLGTYLIVTGKSVVDIYPGASTEKICANEVKKYINNDLERNHTHDMSDKLTRCIIMKKAQLF